MGLKFNFNNLPLLLWKKFRQKNFKKSLEEIESIDLVKKNYLQMNFDSFDL